MRKYLFYFAVILAICLLSGLGGWLVRGFWDENNISSTKVVQVREGGTALTNPLLDCEMAQDTIGYRDLIPFKKEIEKIIESLSSKYKLSIISVYFRDLNNGSWFGINEKYAFAPASLLKVPLMIAWLKQAETYPLLLDKKIKYHKNDIDYNEALNITPSQSIVLNNYYTVEELIHYMIVYSDNNANNLLFENMDKKKLVETYRHLDITPPYLNKAADYMSVKEYSSVFRILFNSTYLSRSMSEKALKYLTRVEYNHGLVSSIPADTIVAHKFGERVMGNQNEIKELHDCGIVYYPNKPYLLCIMTRGTDFEALNDIIGDISYLVYQDVSKYAGQY